MVSTAVGDETTQDMDDPSAGSDPDDARSPVAADDFEPGEDQPADAGAGGQAPRWVRMVACGTFRDLRLL